MTAATGAIMAAMGLWLALIVALAVARPGGVSLKEALRLVPDTLRLLKRLAFDPEQPRGVRLILLLCVAYLASPIDLVPDFLPVIGHVDDAIVMLLALRWVLRVSGRESIARHWPGSADGLRALLGFAQPSD